MNLFDAAPCLENNSYFCTWMSQTLGSSHERQLDATWNPRDAMNEAFVFGPHGAAAQFPTLRKHLILMLDDGWDVGYGLHMGRDRKHRQRPLRTRLRPMGSIGVGFCKYNTICIIYS